MLGILYIGKKRRGLSADKSYFLKAIYLKKNAAKMLKVDNPSWRDCGRDHSAIGDVVERDMAAAYRYIYEHFSGSKRRR